MYLEFIACTDTLSPIKNLKIHTVNVFDKRVDCYPIYLKANVRFLKVYKKLNVSLNQDQRSYNSNNLYISLKIS
jgi:hypothetical protein